MTEAELKKLISAIVAEEFDKHTTEGLLPINTDSNEVQQIFEFTVEAIYVIILSNEHLKNNLPKADHAEVESFIRRAVKESDLRTREKMNLPYREE